MGKKFISQFLPSLNEAEIANIHTSLGNDIEYVADAAERKALTEGVVGATRSHRGLVSLIRLIQMVTLS